MNHLQEGAHVPSVTFKTRVKETMEDGQTNYRWQDLTSSEVFDQKKVVLFALPGAFTPTCSSTHLPGYEAAHDDFKALGVDAVICLSVNDAFVMNQWGKAQNAEKTVLLPDGNADFTRGMGMLVKKNNLGFGDRSWRYSMFVDNGEIKKLFVEPGFSDDCPTDPFEVSDAKTMLDYLRSIA